MRDTSHRSQTHLRLAAVDGEIVLVRPGIDTDVESLDRELFLLRDELRAVCDALEHANLSQAHSLVSRVTELARAIAATDSHTIAGLKAKAEAIRWVHMGDGEILPLNHRSAQGRIYSSILNDIHRLDVEAR